MNTLGDQTGRDRVDFKIDWSKHSSATKSTREETGDLASERSRCRTLEAIIHLDGRPVPAYTSPEYKHFDQHLKTVKNEPTV